MSNQLPLGHPNFIDPLYKPYHTDYSISPLKFPQAINTPYPLVDHHRRHLGKGLNFRSQHAGICPPGYIVGQNNMCLMTRPLRGTFYTNKTFTKQPLEYSNDKIPYNC